MKKRCFAILLALAISLGTVPIAAAATTTQTFGDIQPDDWFYDSVVYAQERGLVSGTGDNVFSPDQLITRAMFLTFLYRIEGQPQVNGVTFLDVRSDSWYADPVSWARENQLVFGYGDGRFGPEDVLTREQMITILYRYAEFRGYDLTIDGTLPSFTDVSECSAYAVLALRWAVSFHIINGTGENMVSPQADVTRAQIAALLTRFDKNAGPVEDKPYLSHFVAKSTEFITGDECTITFTVRLHGEAKDSIYLCADGRKLAQFLDNGRNEDEIAQDGIYTVTWTTTATTAAEINCYVSCGDFTSREITIYFLDGGTLTGLVCDALNRTRFLSDASLRIYRDGVLYTTATVDENGHYVLRLPAGNYHIEISCDGYVVFNAYATVTGNNNTYTETYMMVEGAQISNGSASGTITSALTGLPLDNVTLYVRNGWNNTTVGEVVATGATDASGHYAFQLPLGNYTVYAVKEGYISVIINIIVTVSGANEQNGSISPEVTTGDYRVVLTWGESPSDLDSHLQRRDPNGNDGYHVYFSDKNGYVNNDRLANLDVDDTTSYGPETVTLSTKEGDTYYYYIHDFSGGSSYHISNSGAIVRLYQGSLLLGTYFAPTDQGSGRYWNVFALKDGRLILNNTITSSPDTSYAQ